MKKIINTGDFTLQFQISTWKNGNTYEYKLDYDLLIILSKNGHANSDTLTQSIPG